MAKSHLLLLIPLGLLFAGSLTAQRGQHGGAPSAGGSRGGGSVGSAPRAQAPSPQPRPSAPAPQFSNPQPRPSPTPRFSNPAPSAPRFANPSPAPMPRASNPGVGQPRYSNPTPNPAPSATPRVSNPGVNYRAPANGGSPGGNPGGTVVTRPTVTPRVTTRTDVQPSPGVGRYQPSPSTTAPVGGTVRRGEASVTRPTPTANGRPTTPSSNGVVTRPQPSVVPNRYQPTLRSPSVGSAPTTTPTGAKLTPRSTATPAPVAPRGSTAVSVPRYGTAPSGSNAPRAATRPTAAVGAPRVAPNLSPRAASPRLSSPRPTNLGNPGISNRGGTRLVAPIANTYGAPRYTWGRSNGYRGTIWNSWWDPCGRWGNYGYGYNNFGYDPFGYCGGYGGLTYFNNCGSFGFGISLWQPWLTWRSSYWNNCYSTSWWNTWSSPGCLSSGYWWYPSTVYQPTYLYVPNTVYVPTTVNVPTTIVYASDSDVAPTVAAGGSVVGGARGAGLPGDAGSADMAIALAIKYVDLGDFYFRSGRFDDAVEAYGKARSYAPNDASVHFVLADASFANGDYHYAAFLIAEAVRLDPTIVSATTDKRTFYSDVKEFDAQMAALDTYLAKQPYDAMAQLVRGYNLRFSGQEAEAAKSFARVLEIDPDHRAAKAFVAGLAAAGR